MSLSPYMYALLVHLDTKIYVMHVENTNRTYILVYLSFCQHEGRRHFESLRS